MNDDERRLAALIKEAVPSAPGSISVNQERARVAGGRSQRPYRFGGWLPAVAAACVVLLVAVGSVLLVRGRSSSGRPIPAAASATSTAGLSTSPLASTSKASSRPAITSIGRNVGPWSARALAVTGNGTLFSSNGNLYVEGGSQLTRYAPATGQAVTHAPISSGATGRLLVTPTALWRPIMTSSGLSLQTLDPDSLQVTDSYPVTDTTPPTGSEWIPQLASGSSGSEMFLGYGDSVYALNASSGTVENHVAASGEISAVAVTPDGKQLYVAVKPEESNTPTLLALDTGHDLATMSHTVITGDNASALLATGGGLWITSAGGHADSVRFAPFADLTSSRPVASGGGGLPTTVTEAGGTVWIGGTTTIACADPTTGTVRSQTPVSGGGDQSGYLAAITQVSGRWIASYQAGDDAGIATFTPPTQCQ